jgi:uncharacterized protein (DUF486 family)
VARGGVCGHAGEVNVHPAVTTVALLCASNVFMTFAWYWHLRGMATKPLWIAILVSWGIAFFEYCLMVPANRIGYTTGGFSGVQLKVMQEVITLTVFSVFAVTMLRERLAWNHLVSFVLLVAAAWFSFGFGSSRTSH